MNKINDTYSTILGALGISASIANISSILSVILLALSIFQICAVWVPKILKSIYQQFLNIKNKIVEAKSDGKITEEEIKDIFNEIDKSGNEISNSVQNLKEELKNLEDNKND